MDVDGGRKSGTVKWFNDTKGFGFITPEDGGEELFVHQSAIRTDGFRSLGDGENVEYVVETGSDGRNKAADVTGPNEGPVQGRTVKWFNDTKGFGFITPEDGGEELFVHQSAIRTDGFRSLGDGENVEYVVETGSDGRNKAADVTGPNEGPVQGSTRGGGGGGGDRYGGGGGYNGGSRGGRGGGGGYGG
ncbi:hypothetical protein M8C21_017277, partial [Ambrosia artemisiifolia]